MSVPLARPAITPVLSVQQLAVHFGALRALDGVDLDIYPGELVALAGENGAGKSTLVRAVAGDLGRTRGDIYIDGRRAAGDPSGVARQGVAVVWQDLALCDNLDVAANVMLGAETRWLMRSSTRLHAAAAELLERCGIDISDTTRNVRTLSGGQRQMVAVARAMRDRPRLLILDEPTASLGVQESAQVEELTSELRRQGTTVLLVCHDIEQMYRLADRIVVLRHGRLAGEIDPALSHPDDVMALVSGQHIEGSARRQLSRLHGLVDRLASAAPSSSLALILSALGAALDTTRICFHLLDGSLLRGAAFIGLPPGLRRSWQELTPGPEGGSVGVAALTGRTVVDTDVATSLRWAPFRHLAAEEGIRSSWSVPVMGPDGLLGVISLFRAGSGYPSRDELDLVSLYAGYVASAVERDRLLGEVTGRNRVLETIRDVLETLAGPVPLSSGLAVALEALRLGLMAAEVALYVVATDAVTTDAVTTDAVTTDAVAMDAVATDAASADGVEASAIPTCRAWVGEGSGPGAATTRSAASVLAPGGVDGVVRPVAGDRSALAVTFTAPAGRAVVLARWYREPDGSGAALLEDAAHSLRLALEREEAQRAHQETAALRRSGELQRDFLSRLSHELRTPLTAIRGFASSLMQPDVTWDTDSQQRFLSRMAAESARLGRLVDDLMDVSAIEAGILRLHPDWCELSLVLDAAAACLPLASAPALKVTCQGDLPVVWADHDRLEQVLVNLMDNAFRHNPPGTTVAVEASTAGDGNVLIRVADDGAGLDDDALRTLFEPHRQRRSPTAGAGLGLSITKAIVDAHGGRIAVERLERGTAFTIWLPVEQPEPGADEAGAGG